MWWYSTVFVSALVVSFPAPLYGVPGVVDAALCERVFEVLVRVEQGQRWKLLVVALPLPLVVAKEDALDQRLVEWVPFLVDIADVDDLGMDMVAWGIQRNAIAGSFEEMMQASMDPSHRSHFQQNEHQRRRNEE